MSVEPRQGSARRIVPWSFFYVIELTTYFKQRFWPGITKGVRLFFFVKVDKWSFMSRELERTLQILTAVILAGLTIPLWNNNLVHQMIIIGLLLILAKVMFKVYREG